MIYGSVCSGIEAATVAWHPLGWRPAFFSEIDKFPRAVLQNHYPDVPLHGDFTTIGADDYGPIDLLVGGTPCQSFSIAGLRGGLGDDRGNLALEYLRLAARKRPDWLVWENVPGVLSSNGGRDFGAILGGMVELGYGFAYRVLDAQYIRTQPFPWAVPQRRRRVFVVGYLGDWRPAAAVLFDRESLQGHPPPSRQAGEKTSAQAAYSLALRGRDGTPQIELGNNVANAILTPNGGRAGIGVGAALVANSGHVSYCLAASAQQSLDAETETLIAFNPRQDPDVSGEVTHPLGTKDMGHAIAFSSKDHGGDAMAGVSPTLRAMGHAGSHPNAGGQVAVAFAENSRAEIRLCGGDGQVSSPLTTGGGKPGQGMATIAIQEEATRENIEAGPQGPGFREDGAAFTLKARNVPQSVAFDMRGREGGSQFEGPHDTANIRAGSGGSSRSYVMETNQYANASETRPGSLLPRVRREIGEEAFCKWGLGIAASLFPTEVLQSALHGCELRPASFSRRWVVYCALSRPQDKSEGAMQSLREAQCEGCASQGRKPPEQFARELGAYLSELSQPGAQAERFLRDMWEASEGLGVLLKALSAIQETWRPTRGEGKPEYAPWKVRRLTADECEFLQGFPRGYTNIPWRGKDQAPDGPRYKALGNSMAVNVMGWIGERIDLVRRIVEKDTA